MSINDDILDASIAHQVDLQGYSNGVVNRMLALIKRTDSDLFTQINDALERLPAESFTVRRLDRLLKSVRDLNTELYGTVSGELERELAELAEYEISYQKQLFDNTLPTQVRMVSVSAEQVYAASLSRPFQGKLLREWMQGLDTDRALRIRDTIRIGYIENQTIGQIVQRIRGTRARKYKDGILDITRRNAEAVVRTAVSHTAQYARSKFFEANDSVVKHLLWSSTLDGRTTEICRARDGKAYTLETKRPIGHSLAYLGGAGNAHFGCRSTMVAVTKSWRELGIDADELPASTRASMDGQLPDDITYEEWLKKKPASFQNEVLGVTKGKAFRKGLSLDRFENNRGRQYTIDELKARDSQYFS